MKKRIIFGVLGGALFLFLILRGGILLYLAVALLTILGLCEYNHLARSAGYHCNLYMIISFSLLNLLARAIFPTRTGGLVGLFLLLTLIGSFFQILKESLTPKSLLRTTGINLFGLVYPGLLFSYIILIRELPSPFGWKVLLFSFLVIWANDTGAYFIGSALGKSALAPTISPRKTVEGAVGGVVTGTLVGTIFGLTTKLPFVLMLLTPVISLLGQAGDLFESVLKRAAGVKDSGRFLPGHGGVLDRFDSALFVLPFIYYVVLLWNSFYS